MSEHFILQGKTPIPVDHLTWANWFQTADRIIAYDKGDGIRVSTVFLGLNHEWNPEKPPLIFETMIFGGEFDQNQWRYSTYDEAVAGHAEALKLAGLPNILESEVID